MRHDNVARLTKQYVSDHPSVKDCLRKGLLNYSALARAICREHKLRQFDAVLIACRRYYQQVKHQQLQEQKIRQLLRGARIQLKNKVAVVIIDKHPREYERIFLLQKQARGKRVPFMLVEGGEALVIITTHDHLESVLNACEGSVLRVTKNVVQVHMLFHERIETTPGVVSFVYGLLAENSINVLEEMSCWTDLMFIVSEDDAAKVLKLLGSFSA